MKTLGFRSTLFACVVGCMAFASCSEKEDDMIQGAVSLDVAAATFPEDAQVRAASLVLSGNGGTVTVPVKAGLPDGMSAQYTVTIADAPVWCRTSMEGSMLTVVVDKSTETSGRVASMEIAAVATGAEIRPLTVSVQQGEKVIPSGNVDFNTAAMEAPANATYTNGVVDLTYVGGKIVLPVINTLEEQIDVEYTVEGTLPEWCTAVIADGKLVIEAEPSVTPTVDQAAITVAGKGKTETVNLMAATVKVNRAPFTSAMPMVLVKAGTYTMGDGVTWRKIWDEGGYTQIGREIAPSSNYYKYPVTLDAFYIATTEITQKLYQQVMGKNPSDAKFTGDNYPVININWSDACEFCNALSEKEGLTLAYTKGEIIEIPDPWGWGPSVKIQDYKIVEGANGYRLATSAEWEFAAKGGNAGVGNPTVYAGGNEEDDVLWYQENSKVNGSEALHEIAQKRPNALGLYDMSGNVAEWVYDWGTEYADREARAAITGVTNPTGPEWKEGMDDKVARGGSYRDYDSKCYVYNETNTAADVKSGMGIRVVRSVK